MKKDWIKKLKEIIVTGFFTGYTPFLPGTFGTLIGVIIYVIASKYSGWYYLFIIILIFISVPLADYAEKHIFSDKDSPHIVIDEIVGYLISMISFPFDGSLESIKFMVIGFILFRVFDMWKPYPINLPQKMEGGLAIVIDDILAAIITNLFLQFLRLNKTLFFI